MIVDVRTYTLVPRKLPGYLEIFETYAMPIQRRHGLELIGYYSSVIGPLNQVVHIWRYESLADMEVKRANRDADPEWQAFLARTEGMVMTQESKVMKPAAFSPEP